MKHVARWRDACEPIFKRGRRTRRCNSGMENPRRRSHIATRVRGGPLLPQTSEPLPSFRSTILTQSPQSAPAITIYTTAVCPYCVAAKNFLKSKDQTWTEVRVDLDPEERSRMQALTKRTSVPQIFVGNVHVGGYDDMIAMHRAGKLDPLLAGEGQRS
ncbi:hypothetical protein GCM10007067_01900 [Lysobacter bugurensis]|uniref:Glutaredoxin n=1 Tax=Cognatilysobacter bugurensis TaxID=543356 RepID=A0A918W3R8_9GAMM|nr:hypothetical protein GCM10007067_01900 [Lysobacter bugurensis]